MSQYSDFENPDIERHEEPHREELHVNGAPEAHEEMRRPQLEPAVGDADEPTWHAEAGRKGAQRIHQLIQEGRLYEKEHGLKRGRQRLRQLIELGKLYERDHGLRPERPRRSRRLSRMSKKQALTNFFESLIRIAKPSLRPELLRILRSLEDQAA
jgi:hypothetical protein